MPPIVTGLLNQLDAAALSAKYTNGQDLTIQRVPDQINPSGWSGSGYNLTYQLSASPTNLPAFQFVTGNLTQNNNIMLLSASSMTVQIACQRTGPSWSNSWMGLYNLIYQSGKRGLCVMAITDNLGDSNFAGWGTYNNLTTYCSTSALALNTPTVITIVGNPDGSGTFYTNNTQTGTYLSVQSTPGAFTSSKGQPYFGLGGFISAYGSFYGNIFETLVYNRSLSASEINANVNYLATKWF